MGGGRPQCESGVNTTSTAPDSADHDPGPEWDAALEAGFAESSIASGESSNILQRVFFVRTEGLMGPSSCRPKHRAPTDVQRALF